MSDNKELLPCPFCGSQAGMQNDFGVDYWVQCKDLKCGAVEGHIHNTTSSAIAAWNRRATAPVAEPVTLSDTEIEALWDSLPGIQIHNIAASVGMSTQYALRIAFARAILAASLTPPVIAHSADKESGNDD